jgi:hypothetical protein
MRAKLSISLRIEAKISTSAEEAKTQKKKHGLASTIANAIH